MTVFVPPASQQRRLLGNALFKEKVTPEGQTAFNEGSWHGGTLAQAGLWVRFHSMPKRAHISRIRERVMWGFHNGISSHETFSKSKSLHDKQKATREGQ